MSTVFERADEALRKLIVTQFLYQHPERAIFNCEATERVFVDALENYEHGALAFTLPNCEFIVKEKPELWDQMAPAPVATPKENVAQAEHNLRQQLAERILQATRESFNDSLTAAQKQAKLDDLARHFKYWTVQQLQQKLTDIEAETRYRLLSFDELRKTTRAEYAQRHTALAGQTFESIPPELDAKTLKRMIYTMQREQYEMFKRKHGIDAINARLAGGQ